MSSCSLQCVRRVNTHTHTHTHTHTRTRAADVLQHLDYALELSVCLSCTQVWRCKHPQPSKSSKVESVLRCICVATEKSLGARAQPAPGVWSSPLLEWHACCSCVALELRRVVLTTRAQARLLCGIKLIRNRDRCDNLTCLSQTRFPHARLTRLHLDTSKLETNTSAQAAAFNEVQLQARRSNLRERDFKRFSQESHGRKRLKGQFFTLDNSTILMGSS